MSINLNSGFQSPISFENRIGATFDKNDGEKSKALKKLETECEGILTRHDISPSDRLFYSESMKLIKSTLFTIDVIDKSSGSIPQISSEEKNDLNNEVIKYFDTVVDYSEAMRDQSKVTGEGDLDGVISEKKFNTEVFMNQAKTTLVEKLPASIKRSVMVKIDSVDKAVHEAVSKIRKSATSRSSSPLLEGLQRGTFPLSAQGNVTADSLAQMDAWNKRSESPQGKAANFARHLQNVKVDKFFHLEAKKEIDVFTEARIEGDGDCGFSAMNWTRKDAVTYFREKADDIETRKKMAPEIIGVLTDPGAAPDLRNGLLRLTKYDAVSKLSVEKGEAMSHVANSVKAKLKEIGVDDRLITNIESIAEVTVDFFRNSREFTQPRSEEIKKLVDTFKKLEAEQKLIGKDFDMDGKTSSKEAYEFYVENYYNKGGYLVLPDKGALGDKAASGALSILAEEKGTPVRVWKRNDANPGIVFLQYQSHEITEENKDKTLDMIHGGIHYNKLVPNEVPDSDTLTTYIEEWKKAARAQDVFKIPYRAMKREF